LKDHLQVAIDISGDGKLQLPPYPANAPTAFYNITIFLSSYVTGLNLTITNGTAGSGNTSLGDILAQEPGSTVKHVNWIWPDCFVGNGPPTDSNSARGVYNACYPRDLNKAGILRANICQTDLPPPILHPQHHNLLHNLRPPHLHHQLHPRLRPAPQLRCFGKHPVVASSSRRVR